jgi:membrane carboxypeptidase/penicillin-binding protein
MWITEQIGIDSVLRTSRSVGVRTPLERYPTTALGASEMNLLELANACRTIASGIVAEPYVIRAIVRDSGEIGFDDNRSLGSRETGGRLALPDPLPATDVAGDALIALPVLQLLPR